MDTRARAVQAQPTPPNAGTKHLALWCLWCAPLVAPDPPDGVFVDIGGSAHLFGGEGALLATLSARLREGGFAVRAVVADMPGAAWALARFAPCGTPPVVAPGQMAA